jgi:DNA repair photolyase
VSIQVNPIIPGVTSHDDIRTLFRRLAEVGANHVIVKFVEAGYSWAPTMVERMVKRFGDRGREFARLFTENMGGQRTVREEDEDNPGQPGCGDELAGQANALEFKEFRQPIGRGTPRTEVQELIQLGVRKDASY